MSPEEPAPSRRKLLGAAAMALGAAGVASGCGSSSRLHVGTIAPPARESDITHLNRALALKQYAVSAYTAATPLLHGREYAAAKLFLGEDLTHVSELMSIIKHAGGIANPPSASYNLGHPNSSHAILSLLDRAENEVISGFLELLPRVSPGSVRATLASIIGADAQQVSVLRLALRRNPIPTPFVTGRE